MLLVTSEYFYKSVVSPEELFGPLKPIYKHIFITKALLVTVTWGDIWKTRWS